MANQPRVVPSNDAGTCRAADHVTPSSSLCCTHGSRAPPGTASFDVDSRNTRPVSRSTTGAGLPLVNGFSRSSGTPLSTTRAGLHVRPSFVDRRTTMSMSPRSAHDGDSRASANANNVSAAVRTSAGMR